MKSSMKNSNTKLNNEPSQLKTGFKETLTFMKSDGVHFFIGLVFVFFALFLLLAFTSYFFNEFGGKRHGRRTGFCG